ncbi:DSBA-like thioredoxin domain-containing protein [Obelidium mucronatum]|nr:DSBA-like thioredoxin domain-containing protein [Obelidium mucronatum]
MSSVKVYYDVVSPYSWFGVELLLRYKPRWPAVAFELVPFSLGAVMKLAGNVPPATNPFKGKQLLKEIKCLKDMYDVDIGYPAEFPQMTLHAQRILTALRLQKSPQLENASKAFWKLYWHDKKSITSPSDLFEYLSPLVGSEAAKRLIEVDSQSPQVKTALIEATNEAVNTHGAFGAPWIVVERASDKSSMTFFGSDKLEAIAWFLNQKYEGPCPPGYKTSNSKL